MSTEQFLANVKTPEEGKISSVVLPQSLLTFLDELAAARKLRGRSAALREILTPMKIEWDTMTPAQKKGVAYEA